MYDSIERERRCNHRYIKTNVKQYAEAIITNENGIIEKKNNQTVPFTLDVRFSHSFLPNVGARMGKKNNKKERERN